MAQWFIIRGSKQHGPVADAKLRQLAVNGKLLPDDIVRREDMPSGSKAKDIKGLFPLPIDGLPAGTPSPTSPVNSSRSDQYDHHVDEDDEQQPEQRNFTHKQKAVAATLIFGTLLLYACWQTPKLFSSWIFWNWVACVVILPAMLHEQSMAGGAWRTLGEVVLRSLLSYTAGAALGFFVGAIGINIALGALGFVPPTVEWFLKWGIVLTSTGVAFIPPRLSVLAALFAGTAFILMRSTYDRKYGLCPECQGTGYCWPCRGAGCGRCIWTGGCGKCLGTGGQMVQL
jgi:hypothetical protein